MGLLRITKEILGITNELRGITTDILIITIVKIDNNKKELLISVLSDINPKIGATIANEILKIKLLTDITVALVFDFEFKLIWFLSIGVSIPLK